MSYKLVDRIIDFVPHVQRIAGANRSDEAAKKRHVERITPLDTKVLLILARHANDNGEGAIPGLQSIADRVPCSRDAVKRSIRRWENLGVIKSVPRFETWPSEVGHKEQFAKSSERVLKLDALETLGYFYDPKDKEQRQARRIRAHYGRNGGNHR